MRAVVQRVTEADVTVDGRVTGTIRAGLVVLLGVEAGDAETDAAYMAEKICGLRVFEDDAGKMNLCVKEKDGSILAISQFTLLGDVRKGKRPSFTSAAKPDEADALYRYFIDRVRADGVPVEQGVFQADMLVRICNDGPVTILIDSRKVF